MLPKIADELTIADDYRRLPNDIIGQHRLLSSKKMLPKIANDCLRLPEHYTLLDINESDAR